MSHCFNPNLLQWKRDELVFIVCVPALKVLEMLEWFDSIQDSRELGKYSGIVAK